MKNKLLSLALACSLCLHSYAADQNAPSSVESADISNAKYNADWAEFDNRPLPSWFNEAKFGIFVVWGVYSVPSWMPSGYAEWYWSGLKKGTNKNTMAFHKKNYGDRTYEDLAHDLTASMFNPDDWCKLFKRSGAKYVITTANYHDGFTMYPTEYSLTESTDTWNSTKVGPMRDIIGELNVAGEKQGLKMGIYFSLYEWFHPLWDEDPKKFATEWFHPKFKECVTRYEPWSVFFDGDWGQSGLDWGNNDLARWLYTESSVKDKVVVNDRWGSTRGLHSDVFESEYGNGKWNSPKHPWQEDRGIGRSYGYNRNESVDDYNSSEEIIQLLSNVAGGGGNLLLCVGPTADGRIPVIMQERLVDVGDWLNLHGDAIYGSTASPFWPRTFEWGTITQNGDKLYLHIHNPKCTSVTIDGFNNNVAEATMLDIDGNNKSVDFKVKKGSLTLSWDRIDNDQAVTIIQLDTKLTQAVDTNQHQWSDGKLYMTAHAFNYHNTSAQPLYGGFRNRFKLSGWKEQDGYATTTIHIEQPGCYDVGVAYVTDENDCVGSQFDVEIAGEVLSHTTIEVLMNDTDVKIPQNLGSVNINKAGDYDIIIRATDGGVWSGLGLHAFELKKIK